MRLWRNWSLCTLPVGRKSLGLCGKHFGSSQKVKIELSYDPTIPHLGIDSKRLKTSTQQGHAYSHQHMCNSQKVEIAQMSIKG